MLKWKVGLVEIAQVVETEAALPVDMLFPGADPTQLAGVGWLRPFLDDQGFARLGINAYLVQTSDRRIIVDCCAGNDKPRGFPGFNMQSTPFLDRLSEAGFGRETIDTVVCTHLHVDHVGWNTMLADGEWVPTFPNARYLVGRTEFEYWRTQEDSPDERTAFQDSVQPVVDAGLMDLVEAGHRIGNDAWLIATPGHTPGHHSLRITSGGEEGIISGDMVHHPAQIARPEWSCFLDYDGNASAEMRRKTFAEAASDNYFFVGTHFVAPSAGRIVADGDGWRLDY
jgi:glyoxylase-like metal-dependent hydrolase (beta-lactamase superfamily II)